jgi:hypothetical protein
MKSPDLPRKTLAVHRLNGTCWVLKVKCEIGENKKNGTLNEVWTSGMGSPMRIPVALTTTPPIHFPPPKN